MDASQTPNPDHNVNSTTPPPPEQPNGDVPPAEEPSWLRKNGFAVLFLVGTITFIALYLNFMAVLIMAIGLGLVIFIHELGHFLAAKACNVHVRTFSIGFGPALPGCSFQIGETNYKLALVPLGGYVAMVGEGETGDGESGDADDDEADRDPRSYRNKPVWQRMIIISAGVIMNIVLAAICFVIAYSNGVREAPAIIGSVESGSAAWRVGLRPGQEIVRINHIEDPFFNDVRPVVMASDEGEKIHLVLRTPGETELTEIDIEPTLEVSGLFPQMGFVPPYSLTLNSSKQKDYEPFQPGSPAETAKEIFRQGDRIIAMTDPETGEVTELPLDPRDTIGDGRDYFTYYQRLYQLRGQDVTIRAERDENGTKKQVEATIPSGYHRRLGLRMKMGPITAIREGSPAAKAGIQASGPDPEKPDQPGDQLTRVEVRAIEDGKPVTLRWVTVKSEQTEPDVREQWLDPVRLPFDLEQWSATEPEDWTVTIEVLRSKDHSQEGRERFELEWERDRVGESVSMGSGNAPLSIGGLGLAYRIQAVVDTDGVIPGGAAAKNKDFQFQTDDVIQAFRPKMRNKEGELEDGKWIDIKPYQWATRFFTIQWLDSPELTLRVLRGEEEHEVTLTAEEDSTWPTVDRGFSFQPDHRLQKADGMLDAVNLGMTRTWRTIVLIYQNLSAMIFGRISTETVSGPIGIASISYTLAEEDIWTFILFIGMISVNLAVVNFLPIPILDGGHMVFLMYEAIRGKPAPERVQVAAMFIGLALILSLMVLVIVWDISKFF